MKYIIKTTDGSKLSENILYIWNLKPDKYYPSGEENVD